MLNLREGQSGSNFNQIGIDTIDQKHEIINWDGDADLVMASHSEVHKLRNGKIQNILAFDNSLVDATECHVSSNLYSEKSVIFATGHFKEIYCFDASFVAIRGEFMRAEVGRGSQLVCIFDQEVRDINVDFDESSQVVVIYDVKHNFRNADKKILSNLKEKQVQLIHYDELSQSSNNYLQAITERFGIN